MSEFLTIVRAVYSGLSRRKVAAMHKVSRNTVSLYLRQARDQGWLTLEDLEKLDDITVSQGLSQIASRRRTLLSGCRTSTTSIQSLPSPTSP